LKVNASGGSTVVELSTNDLNIKGLNPPFGKRGENKKMLKVNASGSSIVVKPLTTAIRK
jgi:hypothetical protein